MDPRYEESPYQDALPGASPLDNGGKLPSAGKPAARRKRKSGTKTEKRFQRLEGMMAQLLQNQQTALQTPMNRLRFPPETTASLPIWRPDHDQAVFGLPTSIRPQQPCEQATFGLPRPNTSAVPTQLQRVTPRRQQYSLATHLQRRPDASPPPPEALVEDPIAASHIAEVLKQPAFQGTGGKINQVLKPHMFIPRKFASC